MRIRGTRRAAALALVGTAMAGAAIVGFAAAGLVYAGADRLKETPPVASLRSLGGERGRRATAPQEIPPRGWLDIAWRVVLLSASNRLMQQAAAVTFYTLLAIFPALAATVSLYGLFADPARIQDLVDSLRGVVPGGGLAILHGQLAALIGDGSRGLTTGAAVGLGATLWSANQGSKALFDALNIVYREEEKRSYPRFVAVAMAFTLGAMVFVIAAMVVVVVLPALFEALQFGAGLRDLVGWLRWPVILLAVSVFLASLYRFGPSRADPKWRWVSWGAALASLAWVGVSFAYSWYVQRFGGFDHTYGSLGAMVGFMVWIWISTLVALIGAQLNAEMEHQTSVDTTTGAPRPLGSRGSTQADTVA